MKWQPVTVLSPGKEDKKVVRTAADKKRRAKEFENGSELGVTVRAQNVLNCSKTPKLQNSREKQTNTHKTNKQNTYRVLTMFCPLNSGILQLIAPKKALEEPVKAHALPQKSANRFIWESYVISYKNWRSLKTLLYSLTFVCSENT